MAEGCAPCLKTQEVWRPLGKQNAEHPGFVAPDAPFSCAQCIAWHAEQRQFPALPDDDAVEAAWHWYWSVQDQQRVAGMGGTLGLDYTAVMAAWTMAGVDAAEQADLFPYLALLSHEVAAHHARKAAKELERQRNAKRVDQQ